LQPITEKEFWPNGKNATIANQILKISFIIDGLIRLYWIRLSIRYFTFSS
jgi:hypothetical protein